MYSVHILCTFLDPKIFMIIIIVMIPIKKIMLNSYICKIHLTLPVVDKGQVCILHML